jgi:hypothetical protein
MGTWGMLMRALSYTFSFAKINFNLIKLYEIVYK